MFLRVVLFFGMYLVLNGNTSLDSFFSLGFSFLCCFYFVGCLFMYIYASVFGKKTLKMCALNTYCVVIVYVCFLVGTFNNDRSLACVCLLLILRYRFFAS